MIRLKDRNRQIPNGLRFYIPELKWNGPGNFPSFNRLCDAVESVIKANPYVAQQHKWPTDRAGIENWVENYNASLCVAMGWDDFVAQDSGFAVPKWSPPRQQETLQSFAAAAAKAKELVAGARSLTEWEDSGDPPVPRDQATARALICTQCPKNEAGDWTRWFTVPAAEMIKRKIEKAQARALSTIHDEQLKLCSACYCPLQVKVHVPLPWITKRLTPEVMTRLREGKQCWVLAEIAQQ